MCAKTGRTVRGLALWNRAYSVMAGLPGHPRRRARRRFQNTAQAAASEIVRVLKAASHFKGWMTGKTSPAMTRLVTMKYPFVPDALSW
jgi:hypothetical protein